MARQLKKLLSALAQLGARGRTEDGHLAHAPHPGGHEHLAALVPEGLEHLAALGGALIRPPWVPLARVAALAGAAGAARRAVDVGLDLGQLGEHRADIAQRHLDRLGRGAAHHLRRLQPAGAQTACLSATWLRRASSALRRRSRRVHRRDDGGRDESHGHGRKLLKRRGHRRAPTRPAV